MTEPTPPSSPPGVSESKIPQEHQGLCFYYQCNLGSGWRKPNMQISVLYAGEISENALDTVCFKVLQFKEKIKLEPRDL